MTHPYQASEKHRAAFEAWALSYGHDLTDERFYAAAFAGYLAGSADLERAVAAERAERTRLLSLQQAAHHKEVEEQCARAVAAERERCASVAASAAAMTTDAWLIAHHVRNSGGGNGQGT